MTKKIIWLLLAVNFNGLNLKDSLNDDKILWGEQIIEWQDFQGSPAADYNTTIGAYTTTSIVLGKTKFEKFSVPKLKVYCYFVKSKSWTLLNDDYSLNHERLHFDIAELYTRKIRKAFDSLNTIEVTDVNCYKDVWKSYIIQTAKYQDSYYTEVYNNEKQQMEWIKNVKSELNKLNKYKLITTNE